jgi:hypothetical protein
MMLLVYVVITVTSVVQTRRMARSLGTLMVRWLVRYVWLTSTPVLLTHCLNL